jgi:hypothetical protein
MHDLIHINEALSGLPVDVQYISFEDVENGVLTDVDVVINAGRAGDAWSGGEAWKSDKLVAELTRFVHEGGAFIGVGEPSAVDGYHTYFRMANVLGIDKDTGARVCHGKWQFEVEDAPVFIDKTVLGADKHLYLTDGKAKVLHAAEGVPQMVIHPFGKGQGVYMSHFEVTADSTRMLLELLLQLKGVAQKDVYLSDNANVETAYFPADDVLVVFNNAEEAVDCTVHTPEGDVKYSLVPMETKIITK